MRNPAEAGARVGSDAGGGAAVNSIRVGHCRRVGAARVGVFGKTFAGAAGKDYGGLEFRRCAAAEDAGGSGSQRRGGPSGGVGRGEAKDFTEHRYHQPSDEYSPDMDFTGDAVIARFGFVFGSKAAWLPTLAGW